MIGAGAVVIGLALSARLAQRGGTRRRVRLVWAGVACVVLLVTVAAPGRVLAAYLSRDRAFPVVFAPDAWLQTPLWSSNSQVRIRNRPTGLLFGSAKVLEVDWGQERYPGLTVTEVVPDWSGYAHLEVDVWLPPGPRMTLTAAVGHRGVEGTAAHQRLLVTSGFHRLEFPVPSLLSSDHGLPEVTKLILHTDQRNAGRRVLIGTARLTKSGSGVVGRGARTGSR
ncbi:MAG: hypothetical protein RIE06_28035 [Roseibium album]|uniref:hypothetical protein n=1 Tax=Roseibium album TaxID=311410 RepID=UPI0032EDD1D7